MELGEMLSLAAVACPEEWPALELTAKLVEVPKICCQSGTASCSCPVGCECRCSVCSCS